MAFIAYYFHWSNDEIEAMDHVSRRRWCGEISTINRELTPSANKKPKEKSILDMKPSR